MTDVRHDERSVLQRAEQNAVVQEFRIKGLYGYRNLSLSSSYAATILIARNGAGKTTLLGALAAFLKGQFTRLRDIPFKSIHCRLLGVEEELVLTKEDVISFLDVPSEIEIFRQARSADVDSSALFKFLVEEWPDLKNDWRVLSDHKVFASVVRSFNYSTVDARVGLEQTRNTIFKGHPAIAKVVAAIETALNGVEIVYLPTYRRVELALEPSKGDQRRRPKFDVATGSLLSGEIQFGLADISERLAQMNQTILVESNSGYRQLSANIINELVDGSFESETHSDRQIPSRDELTLFFSRLREGRRVGPFFDPLSIPNIDRIYTKDGVPASSTVFLNYFLSKLGTVINATHDVELQVQEFIDRCNSYLSSEEDSTRLESDRSAYAADLDGKELYLNRRNLKVHVKTIPGGRRVTLDALSSGEKQMISLFGKLHLYPGDKIVLIDEPELSLSIDWQRRILVDAIDTASCRQIIAITHSPFVFDNELEPFARALKVSIDPDAPASDQDGLALDEDDLDE